MLGRPSSRARAGTDSTSLRGYVRKRTAAARAHVPQTNMFNAELTTGVKHADDAGAARGSRGKSCLPIP
eukprot:scaffold50227_cov57-Phaeocystis_antarctica.AAC.3